MPANPQVTDELAAISAWLREPDCAEEFSLIDMAEWINRRPLAAIGKITAALAGCVVVPREPTTEVLDAIEKSLSQDVLSDHRYLMPDNGAELLYRAMIDAAPPVSETPISGWRDIASAPEDQMVLAYDRVGGQYVFAFKNRDRWAEVGSGASHLPDGYLSHWMPLPVRPAAPHA